MIKFVTERPRSSVSDLLGIASATAQVGLVRQFGWADCLAACQATE
jgi:hypothetical protein